MSSHGPCFPQRTHGPGLIRPSSIVRDARRGFDNPAGPSGVRANLPPVSNDLTAVIAVVGAATGVGGLVIQIIGAWRERSRLRFRVAPQTVFGKSPRMVIDVFNDSPRATTIRELGLYARPVRIEHRSGQTGDVSEGVAEIDFPFNDHPFFIEAQDMKQFAGAPDILTYGIHADQPLRVYAIDGRNRRIWGDAAPYFRDLIGHNLPIPEDDEAGNRFLRPDGETRHPWPVEPRWKLWKRQELRRGSPEVREFKAKQKAADGTLRVRGAVIHFDPEERADTPAPPAT
jgi:hypothetical protein